MERVQRAILHMKLNSIIMHSDRFFVVCVDVWVPPLHMERMLTNNYTRRVCEMYSLDVCIFYQSGIIMKSNCVCVCVTVWAAMWADTHARTHA